MACSSSSGCSGAPAGPGPGKTADCCQQIVTVEQLAHESPIEQAEAQTASGLCGDFFAAAGLEPRDGYDGHGGPGGRLGPIREL